MPAGWINVGIQNLEKGTFLTPEVDFLNLTLPLGPPLNFYNLTTTPFLTNFVAESELLTYFKGAPLPASPPPWAGISIYSLGLCESRILAAGWPSSSPDMWTARTG